MADFDLVARRSLESDIERRVFTARYLLGADCELCCRQLHMDRGVFFHHVYRIETRLGRVFAELAPYPLYPVADYFSSVERHSADAPRLAVPELVAC